MDMTVRTVLATAALLAPLVTGVGVAHAGPGDVQCNVGGGGELRCEDMATGQSWEQAPGGSYPAPEPSYCGQPYVSSQLCN
jgi:hypothetical protein